MGAGSFASMAEYTTPTTELEAVNLIGSKQVQGRASAGGNLCNGSPAGDSVPAMVAAAAIVTVQGPNGRREIKVEDVPAGPGRTTLKPGEILVSFKLPPRPPGSGDAYLRMIPRTEMDIAVVGVGVSRTMKDGTVVAARVGLGARGAAGVQLGRLAGAFGVEFAPLAAAKGIELKYVPCSLVVRSDRRLLRRVVQNLISNAIKYADISKPDPYVEVRVDKSPDGVTICVADNGDGIDEEHLPKIFDMFYRATQKSSGSGIGLYIVNEITQKMKGTLKVESVKRVGSKFFVNLPNLV